MTDRVRGSVINVHALGATVRLEDGRLAAAPLDDVNRNRATYARALGQKTLLPFELAGRAVTLVGRSDDAIVPTAPPPQMSNPMFEAQIAAYLKQTEEWAPSDRPQPFERHLFRKRARAKHFEAKEPPGAN
jgi:hypothetical protein